MFDRFPGLGTGFSWIFGLEIGSWTYGLLQRILVQIGALAFSQDSGYCLTKELDIDFIRILVRCN